MSVKKKSLPKLRYSENLKLLLVSFAIAFIAWVFAKASDTDEARITVPVVVKPDDPRIELRLTPNQIPVTIRYPRDLQKYISSENFHFEIEAADLRQNIGLDWKSKSQPLTLSNWATNIPQPYRVQVQKIGIESNTVEVAWRWKAQAAMVEPQIVGTSSLPAGVSLVTPVKVTPKQVWIVGTPDALATVPRDEETSRMKLLTEKISVADRTQSSLETVAIQVPAGIEIVQPPTKLAEVNIELQEVQTVREFHVKLDFKALSPDTVSLEYKEKAATVTVFGPPSLLRQLTPESIEIVMQRPSEEVPGTTKDVPLEAQFAPSVPEEMKARLTIRSVEPKTIKVRYVAKPSALPSPKM